MSYILIILGFVFIYLSTRSSNKYIKNTNDDVFDSFLDRSINNAEIDLLKNKYQEMLERINNLESSLILLEDQIEGYKNDAKKELNLIEDNFNDSPNSHDNYIEKDTNSLIFELHDEGKDLDEICSILKLGKGEVLLRLGLRK